MSAADEREVDEKFLKELKVHQRVVAEELFVLRKNKILNVATLCAFSSKEELRNLKAKNEKGEDIPLGEGTIALLWKYIEENRGKKVQYADSTPIVQQLVGPDLVRPPSLTDIDGWIRRPVPAVYPVSNAFLYKCHEIFKRDVTGGGTHGDTFFFLKASPIELDPEHFGLEPLLWSWENMVKGQSEVCTHAAITPLIQRSLDWVFRTLELDRSLVWTFRRNESETKRLRTSLVGKRPDWLMHLDGILVFRGEEKGDTAGQLIDIPAKELASKMDSWNPIFFGELEYVLGYALVGTRFQLYALHPDLSVQYPEEGTCGVRLTSIGSALNLERIGHRCELLQYMFNLAKVFVAMASMLPRDGPYLEQVDPYWKRDGSGDYSQLTFFPRYVRKKLIPREHMTYDFDVVSSIYAKVKDGTICNTIKCHKDYPQEDGEGGIILHLYPIGKMDRKPMTDKDLQHMALDILLALQTLHSAGFCHRDVRWPNIIQKIDGRWLLIDLDFCAPLNDRGFARWPSWNRGVPERHGQELWTCTHDLEQLRRIIVELSHLPCASQISEAISRSLTAAGARNAVARMFGE